VQKDFRNKIGTNLKSLRAAPMSGNWGEADLTRARC
jgi:hypothetical protein